MINTELYIPKFVRISSIKKESDLVKTYRLDVSAEFKPGQFFQVSVLGAGEVPISISSSPLEKDFVELTVRNTGKVTGAIHSLREGSCMGLRGPYGNFFPVEKMAGKDLIFVAGGIGLAPLRSLVRYVLDKRKMYRDICILYGAKTPDEMIFKKELKKWQDVENLEILLTVDKPKAGWKGNVGVVTKLFDKWRRDINDCIAIVCGPPVMIKFTIQKLLKLGLKDENIIVSLERYMKCGVGKCGHCYLVDKYICTDGPVFSYGQLKELKPVEPILV